MYLFVRVAIFFGTGLLSAHFAVAADAPAPLIAPGKQVDWWFAYKFSMSDPFRGCGKNAPERKCVFDDRNTDIDRKTESAFGQQFVFASKENGELKKGEGCIGMTLTDPLGATFNQVYRGSPFYLIWNDQFYGDPDLEGRCGSKGNCDKPWGHSKGMLAWNEAGEGLVLQVTTPSWPASGSFRHKRKAGNTLGCVTTQNNLKHAQHFFALKLNKEGIIAVLTALKHASVVTDPDDLQIARIGGPREIRDLAAELGGKPKKIPDKKKTAEDKEIKIAKLAPDVLLVAKPSNLNVPPWQMLSAILDGESERVATWWANARIYSTKVGTKIGCWDDQLKDKKSGAVVIAGKGNWKGEEIPLSSQNHAKIGVTTSGDKHYAIFSDLNQQGLINPGPSNCYSAQNARGGLFFVVENEKLHRTLSEMLEGKNAPAK